GQLTDRDSVQSVLTTTMVAGGGVYFIGQSAGSPGEYPCPPIGGQRRPRPRIVAGPEPSRWRPVVHNGASKNAKRGARREPPNEKLQSRKQSFHPHTGSLNHSPLTSSARAGNRRVSRLLGQLVNAYYGIS